MLQEVHFKMGGEQAQQGCWHNVIRQFDHLATSQATSLFEAAEPSSTGCCGCGMDAVGCGNGSLKAKSKTFQEVREVQEVREKINKTEVQIRPLRAAQCIHCMEEKVIDFCPTWTVLIAAHPSKRTTAVRMDNVLDVWWPPRPRPGPC